MVSNRSIGGNWRYVFAAFGLVLFIGFGFLGYQKLYEAIENGAPEYSYQPARDAVEPHRRVTGEPRSKAYQPQCKNPQDRENSDLCAQWSAVEAVAESNNLVKIGLWLTAIGTAVTLVGTALLLRSLKLGQDANRIARTVYETDIRPIVVPDRYEIKVLMGFQEIEIEFVWKNIGKMPAKIISKNPPVTVLPKSEFRDGPIKFSLEQLKTEEQIANSSLTYKNGIGESEKTWVSTQAVPLIPALRWPSSDGTHVIVGSDVPKPTAYQVSGARAADDRIEVRLT